VHSKVFRWWPSKALATSGWNEYKEFRYEGSSGGNADSAYFDRGSCGVTFIFEKSSQNSSGGELPLFLKNLALSSFSTSGWFSITLHDA
jgi:hypothetical protein